MTIPNWLIEAILATEWDPNIVADHMSMSGLVAWPVCSQVNTKDSRK